MQDDTACLRGISTEDRQMLDSLLAAVDCERVFYFGKEAKKEAMTESGWYGHDTTYTSFSIPYFSHGYSVGGTSKDFVYDPGLKDRPAIRMTENGELNEIYRKVIMTRPCTRGLRETGISSCHMTTEDNMDSCGEQVCK